jgi:hypothetical protein
LLKILPETTFTTTRWMPSPLFYINWISNNHRLVAATVLDCSSFSMRTLPNMETNWLNLHFLPASCLDSVLWWCVLPNWGLWFFVNDERAALVCLTFHATNPLRTAWTSMRQKLKHFKSSYIILKLNIECVFFIDIMMNFKCCLFWKFFHQRNAKTIHGGQQIVSYLKWLNFSCHTRIFDDGAFAQWFQAILCI